MGNFHGPSKCPYQAKQAETVSYAECFTACCSPATTQTEACCNYKDNWAPFIVFMIFFGIVVFLVIVLIIFKIFCPKELKKFKLQVQRVFCRDKYERAMKSRQRAAAQQLNKPTTNPKRGLQCENNILKRDSSLQA